MMRPRLVVAIVFLLPVLASCIGGGPIPPNYDSPMGIGVRTAKPSATQVADAVARFPVPLRVPSDLGAPIAIQVADRATGAPAGQAGFAFEYRLNGNPLDVIEVARSQPPSKFYAGLHAMVNQWTGMPTLLHGSFTFVHLSDGTEALITTAEDGTTSTILFVDPDNVEVMIQSPHLTANSALRLANDIESS
jgi:hypothetical protein